MSRKKRSTLFSHDAEVGARDVFQLLDELWVTRDLEAAQDVRLQTVGLPVPHDGAGAYVQHCVHHCAHLSGAAGRARSVIRTREHANTRTHSAREPCQLGLLRLAPLKNRGNSQSFSPMQTDVDRWRYLMNLSFFKNQTMH